MKFILNLLKGLAVFYWVLAAALFTSVLFFPSVIDGLYIGYTGITDSTTSSEVVEVSSEEETTSEDETSLEESSSEEEGVGEETSEPVEEEETSEPVEDETEDETDLPSEEEEDLPESQPLRMNSGIEDGEEEEIVISTLTREEFGNVLEEALIYSALFMLPFTILVFTLGSKYNSSVKEVKVEEKPAETKVEEIKLKPVGVTRLRVRK
jgi:hypothetical protein